jgi:hypothetical protein
MKTIYIAVEVFIDVVVHSNFKMSSDPYIYIFMGNMITIVHTHTHFLEIDVFFVVEIISLYIYRFSLYLI